MGQSGYPSTGVGRQQSASAKGFHAFAEAAPLEVKRGYYYSERKESFFFEYVHQQLVERYGARTVWLATFAVALAVMRRIAGRPRRVDR